MPIYRRQSGFTLIELLVAISIVVILSVIGLTMYSQAKKSSQVASAVSDLKNVQQAVEQYNSFLGFYPPDTGRGVDPGLSKALPWDTATGLAVPIPVCPQCPGNWDTTVATGWSGPYLEAYPAKTPWGGKYDYNYWPVEANRYGCIIPPGIYIGLEGDSLNNNTIPPDAEQVLINQGLDNDNCVNGEAQRRIGNTQ